MNGGGVDEDSGGNRMHMRIPRSAALIAAVLVLLVTTPSCTWLLAGLGATFGGGLRVQDFVPQSENLRAQDVAIAEIHRELVPERGPIRFLQVSHNGLNVAVSNAGRLGAACHVTLLIENLTQHTAVIQKDGFQMEGIRNTWWRTFDPWSATLYSNFPEPEGKVEMDVSPFDEPVMGEVVEAFLIPPRETRVVTLGFGMPYVKGALGIILDLTVQTEDTNGEFRYRFLYGNAAEHARDEAWTEE